MNTVLRLYVNTSRGNDPFLHRELLALQLKPKFDQHLHSFYFDAPMQALFSVSFRSLLAENLFLQLAKPFPATSETVFTQQLDRIPFANYLPLHRSLAEQLTLNILVRETQYPLSDNVFSSLLSNALQKQLYRKQYKELLPGPMHLLPMQDIKEIVERKWQHQDQFAPSRQSPLLEGRGTQQLLSTGQQQLGQAEAGSALRNGQNGNLMEQRDGSSQLDIPYQPEMTLYVRRNQARLLLKVNKQPMYKHGWKQKVGWAPIRESIIAAVLNQTQILEQTGRVRLWDPFCGSGTIGLVAAAQWHGVAVRADAATNFTWPHWRIYKPDYLQSFKQEEQQRKRDGLLQLICSDVSFQAANYAIGNLRSLSSEMTTESTSQIAAAVRLKPTDQIFDVRDKQWSVICGDFQKVAANVLSAGPVSIVTNLPYTEGRSATHIPLNQLVSLYRRFSQLIASQADHIQNVFLILNSQPEEIDNPNHFLRVSSLQWTQVAAFQSGGKQVGLYAWSGNKLAVPFADYNALTLELLADRQAIQSLPEQADLSTALTAYRTKIKAIEKKNYFVPNHLKVIRKGWRRVVEKRRQRHLLRAYEIFAKRRDKMQAFAEYANRKLEQAMLKRGRIWRKRNSRLLDTGLLSMEKELKAEFEGRIQEALKRSMAKEELRQKKIEEKKKQEAERQKRALASRPQKLKPKPKQSKPPAKKTKLSRSQKQSGGAKRVWRN